MAQQQWHQKPHQLEYTCTGRPKKPDKWGSMLKAKAKEYHALVERVAELEAENTWLQIKEATLLQIVAIMEALVVDAADHILPGSTECQSTAAVVHPAAGALAAGSCHPNTPSTVPHSTRNETHHAVLEAVQKREQVIKSLYGDLLNSPCTSQQQPMHSIELLKAMCSPHNLQQVSTMTAQQLTARLSQLAGKCALQVLHESELLPGVAAADASISPGLQDIYMEFTALIMSAMVWHNTKFKAIMNTNLDTLQPFEEELPAAHWLNALQRLQLSQQQLRVLSSIHNQHYKAGRSKLWHLIERNMHTYAAHTEALVTLLQQQALQDLPQALADTQAGGFSGLTQLQDAGRAAALVQGASSHVQHTSTSQEVLLDEQSKLLRQWLLLGLHVGIVTACTMSPYQQAVFVAASHPSIPRMDLAMAAYTEHMQRQTAHKSAKVSTTASCEDGKLKR